MAVILSPVPTDAALLTAAVDVLGRAIGSQDVRDDTERLMKVASDTVERYAPTAPQSAKNEAVIRMAGILYGDYGAVVTEGIADQTVTYANAPVGGWSPFRRSGAMGLFSPWRTRRAV